MRAIWVRLVLILVGIGALIAASGILAAPSHARTVTWSYTVAWLGGVGLAYDLYTGTGVYAEFATNHSGIIALNPARSGQVVGVDPFLEFSPGVTQAACEVSVNGRVVVRDFAVRGDGTELICLWRIP